MPEWTRSGIIRALKSGTPEQKRNRLVKIGVLPSNNQDPSNKEPSMGVAPVIRAIGDLPEVQEPFGNLSTREGTFLRATEYLGYPMLHDCSPEQAREALLKVIEELDKGEDGFFCTAFWEETRPQIFETDYSRWESVFRKNAPEGESFTEAARRMSCSSYRLMWREAAFRFFSYYTMGYQIDWET